MLTTYFKAKNNAAAWRIDVPEAAQWQQVNGMAMTEDVKVYSVVNRHQPGALMETRIECMSGLAAWHMKVMLEKEAAPGTPEEFRQLLRTCTANYLKVQKYLEN